MERYLEQLLEDLNNYITKMKMAGISNDETKPLMTENDDDSLKESERYASGEGATAVGNTTNVQQMELPPAKMLSNDQKALLAKKLQEMLSYHHYILDFPERLPSHLKYPHIYKFWKQEHVPMKYGFVHVEFCNYDPENCPFPEYCNYCIQVPPDEDSIL